MGIRNRFLIGIFSLSTFFTSFNSVIIASEKSNKDFYSLNESSEELKDEYLLNSDGWFDKNPASSFLGANTETGINKDLYLGVGSSGYSLDGNRDNGFSAETIVSVNEQKNILSSTDKISEITITPIPFTENKTGEIIEIGRAHV